MLWPPDVKNWLIGKDPDAGKDWRLEEKGKTEDEMVGWHHQVAGHKFEQTPGVGDGQGSLACYNPQGHKESDTTKQLTGSKRKLKCMKTKMSQNVWFHLNEILRMGKSIETEWRLGAGSREIWGTTASWVWGLLSGWSSCLELDRGGGCPTLWLYWTSLNCSL